MRDDFDSEDKPYTAFDRVMLALFCVACGVIAALAIIGYVNPRG